MKTKELTIEEAKEIARSREHCVFQARDGHTVSRERVLYSPATILRDGPFRLVTGLTAEEAKAALDAGAEIEDRFGTRHRPKQLAHDGRYDFREAEDTEWLCAYGIFLNDGFGPFRIVTPPPQPEKPVDSNTITLVRKKESYTASEAAALAALEPGRVFLNKRGNGVQFTAWLAPQWRDLNGAWWPDRCAFMENNAPFTDPPEKKPEKKPELWELVHPHLLPEAVNDEDRAKHFIEAINLVLDARQGKKERGE